jgi:hypothetical protein
MPDWTPGWEEARYGFLWITLFWVAIAYGGRRLYLRLAGRPH